MAADRVLALFAGSTSLSLRPCKTVAIGGIEHRLDSKCLLYNLVKYSPSPSKLVDEILHRLPGE